MNKANHGEQSRPSVGFIGLGHMGGAMAKRLIEAGYALTVYDRTRARAEEIAQHGTAVAATPQRPGGAV